MRTFHTVKAEEIVRIDGLNLDYDFRKNNRDAAMTPHERLKDHDKRRHIATRPVYPVNTNPVNIKEHPENRASDPLNVVDTSGAVVAADADRAHDAPYRSGPSDRPNTQVDPGRNQRPGETDDSYKARMAQNPQNPQPFDPKARGENQPNPFVTDRPGQTQQRRPNETDADFKARTEPGGLPHPAPFKPSWPGQQHEDGDVMTRPAVNPAVDRQKKPGETDEQYKAGTGSADHQRRPNETDEQYDARMHDAAQNLPGLIKFTLTGGEIKEVPENELQLGEGVKVPGAGDYLIESYDIWTDKSLFKVYDRRTFDVIFKAGFT